jgi:glycosyltransferase involved in cell wall biosynthesis
VKITIVVPIYNETDSLPIFLDLIEEAGSKDITFLLVDNGSTSSEVGLVLSRKNEFWSAVRTEDNLGFGGGILLGVRESKSDFVGWMPGNLKVDPREVVKIFSQQKLERNGLYKARRTGRSLSARYKTILAGLIQSAILKSNMFDSGGTPTVCHKEFILGLENPPNDYVFESFILYSAKEAGMKIVRPKVTYGHRKFGQSHWQRGIHSEIVLMRKIWNSSRLWRKI